MPTTATNAVDNTLIGAVDWLPTVASIAGVPLPAGLADEIDGTTTRVLFCC